MWRNRQTRMIQVHVGDRGGSSPFIRTNGWRHHFARKTKQFTHKWTAFCFSPVGVPT